LIGFLILLWAASGVFVALREDLNRIWGVEPKRESGLVRQARKKVLNRALLFILIIVIGLTVVLTILANWMIGVVLGLFSEFGFGPSILGQVLEFLASVVVMTLLFAFIYKVLPQATIAWKDVWGGAVVTAFLVVLTQTVISLYISLSNLGSVYGVASSIIILLVYIYYVTQVLLFGAEFTHVYAISRHSNR
jgi:membrane protein